MPKNQITGALDIFKIFEEVQWTKAYHDKYIKELKKIYKATQFAVFVNDFLKCFKQITVCSEKISNVDLTLEFAARFTVSLGNPDDETTCPFLQAVFNFLFENQDCYHTVVRLQICQFINRLLNCLGANASLDESICDSITTTMTGRLQDKIASVRMQAVYALNRLQDPTDENCRIIKVFLYHLSRDPSADVRCAIINKIVITKRTLAAILSRIYDVKDVVRRDAFLVCSKLSFQNFSIKQRQNILSCGLLDPSAKVQECFKNTLLAKWLGVVKNDYVEFIRSLNIQAQTGLEIAVKCLMVFFKKEDKINLVEYMQTLLEERTLPYDKLNPELVLFWRVLCEYLHPGHDSEDSDEFFEQIVPELTFFVEYIKGFTKTCGKTGEDVMKTIADEFILMQLMEITKLYDLADEVGRVNLSQLCISLLREPHITVKSIPIIINRLSWSLPEVNERVASIVELISDLREPFMENDVSFQEMKNSEAEKNQLKERLEMLRREQDEASQAEDLMVAKEVDLEIAYIEGRISKLEQDLNNTTFSENKEEHTDPVILAKCLTIVKEMVDSKDVKKITPTLRSLLDNFVLPAFQKNLQNPAVITLSLEALGMFCLLDAELAKKQFLVFCFLISTQEMTALKIVFDLLLMYGLKMFNIEEVFEGEDGKKKKTSIKNPIVSNTSNLVALLSSLLESESRDVRSLAADGLCKLYLVGQLHSPHLIARLIALWFSPESANDSEWRQRFGLFLKAFMVTFGAQIVLEKAFMPTLQLFFNAPVDGHLAEVDQDSVAQVLIKLTNPEVCTIKDYCVHSNLARKICEEMSEKHMKHERTVLMRALSLLNVQSTDVEFFDALIEHSDKLMSKFNGLGDKICYKYAVKFNLTMKEAKREAEMKLAESQLCNTLQNTNLSKESTATTGLYSTNDPTNTINGTIDTEKPVNKTSLAENEMEQDISEVEPLASPLKSPFNNSMEEDDEMETNSITSNMSLCITKVKHKDSTQAIVIPGSDDEETSSQATEISQSNMKKPMPVSRSRRTSRKASGIVIPCSDDEDDGNSVRTSQTGSEISSIQELDDCSSIASQDSVFSTPNVARRSTRKGTSHSVVKSLQEETSSPSSRSARYNTRSVKKK